MGVAATQNGPLRQEAAGRGGTYFGGEGTGVLLLKRHEPGV